MPAVRLLTPLFGHAAGTIVRDLPDGVARYITGQAWASWDLTGGTEQSAQTLPDDAPDNYGPEFAEFAERWRRVAGAAGVPVTATPDGTLINPSTGARPAAGQPFTLTGGAIGGLRITVPDAATSAETITITGTLRDGTTWTAAGTLAPGDSEDWPITRLSLASLSWASTGPSAYVEPM